MMKKIIEKEKYEGTIMDILNEEIPYLPYWNINDLKDRCDISFDQYGYVHDCGFIVRIYDHGEDRKGKGWDTAEEDFKKHIDFSKEQWKIAEEYSYRDRA